VFAIDVALQEAQFDRLLAAPPVAVVS